MITETRKVKGGYVITARGQLRPEPFTASGKTKTEATAKLEREIREYYNSKLAPITLQDVYDFLEKHYKYDRFAGRDDWFDLRYSLQVAVSHAESLIKYGESLISHHEDAAGHGLRFDVNLQIVNSKEER